MNRVFLFFRKSVQLVADLVYTQYLRNIAYKRVLATKSRTNNQNKNDYLQWNEYQSKIQLREKWDFIRSVRESNLRYAR